MKQLTHTEMRQMADEKEGNFRVSTRGTYWRIEFCGITHHSTEPLGVALHEAATIAGITDKLGAGSTPPAPGRLA